jgi:hypothetical protein
MIVIMDDDFVQRCEAAVMIETAFLVAPKAAQRRCPVLLGRRPGRLKIIDADLFGVWRS